MGGVDLTNWPMWAVVALTIANLFREPIKQMLGSFLPAAVREHFQNRAARQADREEFTQEVEEVLLNSRLQTDAAQQLRASWREDQWVEMLTRKDTWLFDFLDEKLNRLISGSDRMIDEIAELRIHSERTNELLSSIHIALVKQLDQNG